MDLDCVTVWAWEPNHNMQSTFTYKKNYYVIFIHANMVILC